MVEKEDTVISPSGELGVVIDVFYSEVGREVYKVEFIDGSRQLTENIHDEDIIEFDRGCDSCEEECKAASAVYNPNESNDIILLSCENPDCDVQRIQRTASYPNRE
jgi:hypothetical protein